MIKTDNSIFLLLLLTVNLGLYQNLRLDLDVGRTYYQSSKNNGAMSQIINGDESLTRIDLEGKMSFEVVSEDQDSYHLKVKFLSLAMEMDSPLGNVTIDSNDKSASDVLSRLLNQMLDREFMVKMYHNGFIKEIQMDGLFNGLLDSFPEIPKFQRKNAIERLKQVYGEKAFKGNLEMVTAIFPKKSVMVNDSWFNEVKLESGMSAMMTNEFTLKEYNKRFALIELKSKTKTKDKNSYVPINGNMTKYDLDGIMDADIKVDSKSGWIISSVIAQKFDGTIEIKDGESDKILQTVPMSFDNKMTITGL